MRSRGFVLVLVLHALLLAAAFAAAAVVAGLQEVEAARDVEGTVRLRAAAQAAWLRLIERGASGVLPVPPVGGVAAADSGQLPGAAWHAELRRGGERMLLAAITVREAAGRAVRTRLGVLATRPLRLRPEAAARVRQPPDAEVATRLDGTDRAPAGWDCAPVGPSVPAVHVDSVSPDSAFYGFEGGWDELAAWAARAAARARSGDTLAVYWAGGDSSAQGGEAHGLLVVGGDLHVGAGWRFTGAIITRGTMTIGAGGAEVRGVLVAGGIAVAAGVPAESFRVGYSRCAAAVAGGLEAPLGPLHGAPLVWAW